ncbi:CsgG/HfaB family protein [Flavobacterium sp.]|jgi:TolB-like protein|uniref:CsgG/HfaB family protein n=1 Tax=Flavobacterium sp. TaxID=239 RepID=UPI0037C0370F
MKKNILLLLCVLLSHFCFSQQIKIAIVDFDNTSGIAKYDGLGKAMSSMLISDIEANVSPKRLQLVERSQINKILKEQNFQKTSSVDKASSVKMGKLLGVKYLLVGDIFVLNDALVINSRLVDTETGDIKFTEKKEGKLAQWLFLKTALAKGLATSISMPFTEPVVLDKEINSAVVTTFSNAITEKDKGNIDKSEELLKIVEEFSADFKYIDDIKAQLEELKKQVKKNTEDIDKLKATSDLAENNIKDLKKSDVLINDKINNVEKNAEITSTDIKDLKKSDVLINDKINNVEKNAEITSTDIKDLKKSDVLINDKINNVEKNAEITSTDIKDLKKSGDLIFDAKSYNEIRNNIVSQLSGYKQKNEYIAKLINYFPDELENDPSYLLQLSSITSQYTPCDLYINFFANSLKNNDIINNDNLKIKYYLYQLKFNKCFKSKQLEEKLKYFEQIDISINEDLLKKSPLTENEKAIINLYFFYLFIEDYISQFRDDNKNYETIFSNIYIKSKIKYLQSTFLKSYEKQLNCSNLEINFKNLDQFIKLMINELDDPKILIVEKYFGDDQFRSIQKDLKYDLVNICKEFKLIPNKVKSDIVILDEKKYLSKTKYIDSKKYFDVLNNSNVKYSLIYLEYYRNLKFNEILNSKKLMIDFLGKIENYLSTNDIYENYNFIFNNSVPKSLTKMKVTNPCNSNSFEVLMINGNMPDFKTYLNLASPSIINNIKDLEYVILDQLIIESTDVQCCGTHLSDNGIIWCKEEIERFVNKVKFNLQSN